MLPRMAASKPSVELVPAIHVALQPWMNAMLPTTTTEDSLRKLLAPAEINTHPGLDWPVAFKISEPFSVMDVAEQ